MCAGRFSPPALPGLTLARSRSCSTRRSGRDRRDQPAERAHFAHARSGIALMYYEDFEVGRETETGSSFFTRDDPRLRRTLRSACPGAGATGRGTHRFRSACRQRGDAEPRGLACSLSRRGRRTGRYPADAGRVSRLPRPRLPSSGQSRRYRHFLDADDLEARNFEAALRARWQRLLGRDQRGEETLSFSSLVFAFRRPGEGSGACGCRWRSPPGRARLIGGPAA